MRNIFLAIIPLLSTPAFAQEPVGPCANPYFNEQVLVALNAKNDDMQNGVKFLTLSDIKDIWHNDNYVACRANILDNQGLTYSGVYKWSRAVGFEFIPDVKQPTD